MKRRLGNLTVSFWGCHGLTLAWLQLCSLGPNKLQGVDICSLINYSTIIFSSELIWIDWSTRKVANFSMSKISLIRLIFSLKNIKLKLGEELLLMTLFDCFHFWSTLLSEITPNFWGAPINSNQFRWKNNWRIIYQWAYILGPMSTMKPKLFGIQIWWYQTFLLT